jgi:hypothetical protein
MPASAFVIGFFTALGWWTATKVTMLVDHKPAPPPIEIGQAEKKN